MKFPEDIERVKGILSYLRRENVVGSTGKSILPERFQQLGIMFGMKGIFHSPLFLKEIELLMQNRRIGFDTW